MSRRWILIILALAGLAFLVVMARVPGASYEGVMELTGDEDRELALELEADVRMLAETIGERNVFRAEELERAARFIEEELEEVGFAPRRQTFQVRGVDCHNLEVELEGYRDPDEIIIVGAHYDSVVGSPGANDNGSGVAATLALARIFSGRQPARTLRFVFFVNEEPPFFTTPDMGSLVYARRSGERGERIRGMLSLETIGYYDDRPGTQKYPLGVLSWFYPDRGNFIGFVANLRSRSLLRTALGSFRAEARIPSEGAALPGSVPGVGWSDHWAFWQEGYPAIMLTDTAPFRDPEYHSPGDLPDRLDYERMALVVRGLEPVLERLAGL